MPSPLPPLLPNSPPGLCALLLAGLGLLGCVQAPPLVESKLPAETIPAGPPTPPFTLGPGDVLAVNIAGHPDLARPEVPLRIDPDGNLVLPLIGNVSLSGLSVAESKQALEAALSPFIVDPQVGLSVTTFAARQAFVLGEVLQPGGVPLDRPLNALQVLSLAGGVKDGGDRKQVALLRLQDGELAVHFFNAATPDAGGLVPIHPDDLIFVRLSKGGVFREQIVPVLQAAAPIFGALTNVIVVSDALDK